MISSPWTYVTKAVGYFFGRVVLLGPMLIVRVLFGMGVGLGTYTVVLPELVSFLQQFLNSMPQGMIDMLGAMKVDVALTIIFSAYSAKLGVKLQAVKLNTTANP